VIEKEARRLVIEKKSSSVPDREELLKMPLFERLTDLLLKRIIG